MNYKIVSPLLMILLFLTINCGGSKQFVAVPPEINKDTVPQETIEVTAEKFHFTPEVIRVKKGTLVTLKITAIDGTHGFDLGAFGIDERLNEHETKVVEFYAAEKGEFGFHCSHFCGMGHMGMKGRLIIE